MESVRLAAGSLGPRLAGRLTAELILRSPQYMNCVNDYEIDLRGVDCAEFYCTRGIEIFIDWSGDSIFFGEMVFKHLYVPAGSKINAIENLGATQVRS